MFSQSILPEDSVHSLQGYLLIQIAIHGNKYIFSFTILTADIGQKFSCYIMQCSVKTVYDYITVA